MSKSAIRKRAWFEATQKVNILVEDGRITKEQRAVARQAEYERLVAERIPTKESDDDRH